MKTLRLYDTNFHKIKRISKKAGPMKYEKCPICEEKLRNGVCPMCGYDFNRLGRSRILKDGHWDILTTDKKTSQPKYIHDEKRHPDFKNNQEYKDAVNEDTEENINL